MLLEGEAEDTAAGLAQPSHPPYLSCQLHQEQTLLSNSGLLFFVTSNGSKDAFCSVLYFVKKAPFLFLQSFLK